MHRAYDERILPCCECVTRSVSRGMQSLGTLPTRSAERLLCYDESQKYSALAPVTSPIHPFNTSLYSALSSSKDNLDLFWKWSVTRKRLAIVCYRYRTGFVWFHIHPSRIPRSYPRSCNVYHPKMIRNYRRAQRGQKRNQIATSTTADL